VDIPRPEAARKRRIRRAVFATLAVALIAGASFAVSKLEPASPSVEVPVWVDTVKRGEMVRQVRGLGTLVPEQILIITTNREGRVMRRPALPGVPVTPATVLLELSNPQLEQEVFDAESQLAAADAEYANLKVQLESQRLDQEALAAQVTADYEQARVQLEADESMSELGLLDRVNLVKSRVRAEQLKTRVGLERQRVSIRGEADKAQLAKQQAAINQLKGLLALKKKQLDELIVRAGIHGVLQTLEVEVGQQVAPGTTLARVSDPRDLKAELKVAETQAKDIQIGLSAEIDTRNGVVKGSVMRVAPSVAEGTVTVDVRLNGELPKGARPDLSVEGTIELDRLEDAVYVGRPVFGQPDSTISLFRVDPDGLHASRVPVHIGRVSVNTVEIREGLAVGDRVVLSDMSNWDSFERVRLK
jgi:HlyD family secretion protein